MDISGYVFIGLAVILLIVGFARGFLDMLLSLIALLATCVFSGMLEKYPEQWLADVIKNDIVRTVVAYVITIVVLLAVVCILKWLAAKATKKVKVVRWIDKILGTVLGVACIWAIFGVLFSISFATFDAGAFQGVVATVTDNVANSQILTAVYGSFNPLGEWIVGLLNLPVAVV